ncbi:MAG TPA: hypothetical protein VFY02_10590 [Gaiellaceae bacterium]|nr:hypothetical protein [Gaiellaceae bacterium]
MGFEPESSVRSTQTFITPDGAHAFFGGPTRELMTSLSLGR